MNYTLERGLVTLYLKGPGNGTGNITLTRGLGASTTVVRNSTGTYTITLSDKYAALLCVSGCVIDATTPDDWEVIVAAETVSTNKTIQIGVYKGGAAADLSSDEQIMLQIVLSNSSVIPVKG